MTEEEEQQQQQQQQQGLVTEVRGARQSPLTAPRGRFGRSPHPARRPWQLEGYTLKLSHRKTASGYAHVSAHGLRWRALSPRGVSLGSFEKPEQAALAVAKHRAGAMTVGEDTEEERVERPMEVCAARQEPTAPLAWRTHSHAAIPAACRRSSRATSSS